MSSSAENAPTAHDVVLPVATTGAGDHSRQDFELIAEITGQPLHRLILRDQYPVRAVRRSPRLIPHALETSVKLCSFLDPAGVYRSLGTRAVAGRNVRA